MLRKLFLNSILVIILFSGCMKSDLSQFDTTGIEITPEFAFPIAVYEVDFNQYLPDDILLNPIADTVGYWLDSLFMYENNFYENPFVVSYTLTENFSLSTMAQIDYIVEAMFRLHTQNQIAAGISVQLYLLDGGKQKLDSVFDTPLLIENAQTNNEGQVVEPYPDQIKDVTLRAEKLQLLEQTKYIAIYTQATIPGYGSVYINYSTSQLLRIELGAKVKVKLVS